MGLFTRKAVDSEARLAAKELLHEVSKLSDRLDELHSEHRKLRGRFYAARGEVEVPVQPQESKADVLRRIGYVPGRPAPHGGK